MKKKGDRSNLPERPEGCCAQIGPVPNGTVGAVSDFNVKTWDAEVFSVRWRGVLSSGDSGGDGV
jgi:hypothetical protein